MTIIILGILLQGNTVLTKHGNKEVILVANSIDFELAEEDNIIGFLKGKGFDVIRIEANLFEEYKTSELIVILGGPDAPEGIGEIIRNILTNEEQEKIRNGEMNKYMKRNIYGTPQRLFIIAGKDRNKTREYLQEHKDEISEGNV